MDRFRNIASVDDHLRGKEVKVLDSAEDYYLIQLLEDAGEIEAGNFFSCDKNDIEHYNEENGTSEFYDSNFAEELDDILNKPYETQGIPCVNEACDNDNGFRYTLSGNVISDREGMYVEKKCNECGALTSDGDGEFHTYYQISEFGIERIEE